MKYFIAHSFTQIINRNTGIVDDEYKNRLLELRNYLLSNNHEVFLAHFRENWGKDLMTDKECTADDYKELLESDCVLAFPGNPISGGVHIELGWASSLKKDIYMFLEKDAVYSPLITGLDTITNVTMVYFEHEDSIFDLVKSRVMGAHLLC